MTAVQFQAAQVRAAISHVRAEARRAVLDPTLPPSRRELCWFIMRGARNPKRRRNQRNHGAPGPCEGWHLLAEVISSGCEAWGVNDA